MLTRPLLDFVHPQDRAATLAQLENLRRGQPTTEFENRYLCKDGSWKWLSLEGEAGKCFAAGMEDYLVKPLKLAQMLEKLRQWLPASA